VSLEPCPYNPDIPKYVRPIAPDKGIVLTRGRTGCLVAGEATHMATECGRPAQPYQVVIPIFAICGSQPIISPTVTSVLECGLLRQKIS
jgi:hypothetical protein